MPVVTIFSKAKQETPADRHHWQFQLFNSSPVVMMANTRRLVFFCAYFYLVMLEVSCFLQSQLRRHFGASTLTRRRLSQLGSTVEPSIAIVGSGAVGGYYGARLWETGKYNVKFFMRGEHYETSKLNGLNVTSVHGDIFIPPDMLQAFNDTREIGTVDWVIVAIKSTALSSIPTLISPLLQPGHTRVMAIMNGLIEDDLIQYLKQYHNENDSDEYIQCCGALFGGMALVCSNRLGPGRIDHSYAGLLSSGVAAHSPTTTMEEHKDAFQKLWEPVQIDTVYEPSLLGGRWRKNCWNLPFNGISVAMGGITVDKIVTDPGLRRLAHLVMDETIATANADLSFHGFDESFFLGDAEKKQMFDLSDGMGPYRTSTMIDFVEKRPMEVQYLFKEAVKKANALGVPVPHLETIVLQIEALQRFYNL